MNRKAATRLMVCPLAAALVFSAGCHRISERRTWARHRVANALANAAAHRASTVSLTIAGLSTTAELYEPVSGGPHPAVILLYGYGGMYGGGPAYRWYAATLADAGMVTVICPYIDATHGRQFREPANTRIWIPAVMDTITYLQHQPGVAPDRIGLIGFSMGGFLGLSIAARDSRVKALVDFFGPEPNLKPNDWRRFPPTLILHGASDHIVGVSNSRGVAAKLSTAGVYHELIVYPGQHHGFTDPAATDAHRRTVEFLTKELDTRK